jgi:sec-independent protein translocase protein TatA
MDFFAPRHLIIVLLVVLLVFGTKKLRSFGADLGTGLRAFKSALSGSGSDPIDAADHVSQSTPPLESANQQVNASNTVK